MAVMSDGETYERVMIFGGINGKKDSSFLSNLVYMVEIK